MITHFGGEEEPSYLQIASKLCSDLERSEAIDIYIQTHTGVHQGRSRRPARDLDMKHLWQKSAQTLFRHFAAKNASHPDPSGLQDLP